MNIVTKLACVGSAAMILAGAYAWATPAAESTSTPRNVQARATVVRHGIDDIEGSTVRVLYTLLRVTNASGSRARSAPNGTLLTLSYRCSLQPRHPSPEEIAAGCRHVDSGPPPCSDTEGLFPTGSFTDGGSVSLDLVASASTPTATFDWTHGCRGCRNPSGPSIERGDHLPATLRAGLGSSAPFTASPLTAAEERVPPCAPMR